MNKNNIICGIYQIKNLINNKVYIGQSINTKRRWNEHKTFLSRNKHTNDYLQNSWNKYGEENFDFSILELCNKSDLDSREVFWISFYESNNYKNGYNLDSGGSDSKKFSEETITKMKHNSRGANSKITEDQAKEIKILLSEGHSSKEVSLKLGIGVIIIRNIKQITSYKYLLPELNDQLKNNIERLSPKGELIKQIKKELLELDYYNQLDELSKKYNISNNVIHNIRYCISHKNVLPELNDLLKNKIYIGEIKVYKKRDVKKR